jgi:5-(carboxyamino)imidazole ribonucleotide synthase
MIIGIIGGGQLSKMFIEEANRWNVKCVYLDPSAYCSASIVNSNGIVGSLNDEESINLLASKCDVLTFEIENINVEALIKLENSGKKIIPNATTLKFIKDKGLQKLFYLKNNIPTSDFLISDNAQDFLSKYNSIKSDKLVVKTRTGGYDGKGVIIIAKSEIGINNIPFDGENVIIEECINFTKEISVITARNQNGDISVFPPVEMEFDPKGNLVKFTYCPSSLSDIVSEKVKNVAIDSIVKMNGIGLFAVEMLLDVNDNVFVNEIAPRPHNSGHHTIQCCYTSQYEQLLRVLLNKPLGSTEIIKPGVMINIVGPEGFEGDYELEGEDKVLQTKGAYLHMYGKKVSRHFRKLGHVTIIDDDIELLKQKSHEIEKLIKVIQKK